MFCMVLNSVLCDLPGQKVSLDSKVSDMGGPTSPLSASTISPATYENSNIAMYEVSMGNRFQIRLSPQDYLLAPSS